jgi:hypothetical protein
MKPFARHLEDLGLTVDQVVATSGLERKLVQSIVAGNYNPSPTERARLAEAVGVPVEEVAWGHAVQVEHLYGHGPQFGRSP